MDIVQSNLGNHTNQDRLWSMTCFVGTQLAGYAVTEGIIVDPDANTKTATKIILDKKMTVLESAII